MACTLNSLETRRAITRSDWQRLSIFTATLKSLPASKSVMRWQRLSGDGLAFEMYFANRRSQSNRDSFILDIRPDGQPGFMAYRIMNDNKGRRGGIQSKRIPAAFTSGLMRVVRTGSVATFFASEDPDKPFQELFRFGDLRPKDVSLLRLAAHPSSSMNKFEVRLLDLHVRAEALPKLLAGASGALPNGGKTTSSAEVSVAPVEERSNKWPWLLAALTCISLAALAVGYWVVRRNAATIASSEVARNQIGGPQRPRARITLVITAFMLITAGIGTALWLANHVGTRHGPSFELRGKDRRITMQANAAGRRFLYDGGCRCCSLIKESIGKQVSCRRCSLEEISRSRPATRLSAWTKAGAQRSGFTLRPSRRLRKHWASTGT